MTRPRSPTHPPPHPPPPPPPPHTPHPLPPRPPIPQSGGVATPNPPGLTPMSTPKLKESPAEANPPRQVTDDIRRSESIWNGLPFELLSLPRDFSSSFYSLLKTFLFCPGLSWERL